WKPMSNIAPSPPITQRGRFSHPIWSQRIRTPIAYVGAFSNSEFVHGTRYGLYGYVEVYTVLHPVAATMPHWSPYFVPVAAHIMRRAVPSPQPAQLPAPPVESIVFSFSIMSMRRLSLMYLGLLGPRSLK